MTFNQMLQTLRLAMQDKQPQLYQQMKAAGALDEFLEGLAATAYNEVSDQMHDVATRYATEGKPTFEPDPWKRVQKIEMAKKSLEEIALQQAIEQIESMTTESSQAS